MLLIEAARQACIAALNCEYPNHSWGLAWRHLDVRFLGYAFPLPISMVVHVKRQPTEKAASQSEINVVIELFQVGRGICIVDFAISLIDGARLEILEGRRAKQALESFAEPRAPAREREKTA
jgi:hypothetical protein